MFKNTTFRFFISVFVILKFCGGVENALASNYIKGSGQFSSAEGDSLTFIKAQLLSKATKHIIDTELKAMGHDNELFWQAYNEKFDQYFEPILEKLKSRMGMNVEDESTISVKKKQKYFKALRSKKLKLKSRYGRLDKVIKSYAIEKMSRSSQFPSSRYMKIKAIVNRKKLNKLYFKFIRTEKNRFFRNLYVSIDFDMKNITWSDFGVEVEKDIKDVIAEHWKRWLEDNLKNIVGNIKIASSDDKNKLRERYKIPMKEISSITATTAENEKSDGTFMILSDSTVGALWLKVNIEVKGKEADSLLRIRKCEFKGDFVLIDMNNNNMLSHYDFVTQSLNVFDNKVTSSLSSRVAGLIYRLPLTKFSKFPKILSTVTNNKRFVELSVKNGESMNEIYSFRELLQDKGVTLDAGFSVSSFTKETTRGMLSYRGESSKLISILAKLDGVSLGANRILKIQDLEQPFNFEVVVIPGSLK